MADTYTIPYHCTNCDQDFEATIPKGTEAPQSGQECTHCGCKRGERQRKSPPLSPLDQIRRQFPHIPNPWADRPKNTWERHLMQCAPNGDLVLSGHWPSVCEAQSQSGPVV